MTTTVQAPLMDTLTLGQKELLRGRFLRQCDAYGEPWYCADCLADLPPDHWEHRCEIVTVPAQAEHKTRTFAPRHETGQFTTRRGFIRSQAASAMCTCGWSRWLDSRELAREAAREHRNG